MKKGETRDIMCQNVIIGRYVHVILNRNEYLVLCEVQVFGLGGIIFFAIQLGGRDMHKTSLGLVIL